MPDSTQSLQEQLNRDNETVEVVKTEAAESQGAVTANAPQNSPENAATLNDDDNLEYFEKLKLSFQAMSVKTAEKLEEESVKAAEQVEKDNEKAMKQAERDANKAEKEAQK